MRWDAVNARARGLATHLLGRQELLAAAATGSWLAAVRRLLDAGYPVEAAALASPADFDRAAGRIAARRLALLGRWLGPGLPALAVIYDDEDRHAVRVLLRGAAHGAAPAERLRAVTPTPALPEPALERLAGAESPARLAEGLIRLGHPAGRVIAAAVRGERGATDGHPLLLVAELALGRLFATRSARAARRGGRDVGRFVRCRIDLENAWSLLAAGPPLDGQLPAGDLFLPGGAVLTAAEFAAIAGLREAAERRAALARVFRGSPLGPAFADPGVDAGALEPRALAALAAWQRDRGRRDPLGGGPALHVLLAVRAEAHDVRVVVAGTTLGAPPAVVGARLATAA